MPQLALARAQYRAGKDALLKSLATSGASTRGIRGMLQKLSKHTDNTLQTLWTLAGFEPEFCLVAVGGYGRGELFPHSDVDVLLLLPEGASPDDDAQLKAKIETFITSCWDSGLEIGSSVRSLFQCVDESAKDVTVQTSLLEARLLVGDKKLFAQLRQQLGAAMAPKAFFVAKTLELRQRHNKFENTP
jgi:[protein-PII] uridylyltransferase